MKPWLRRRYAVLHLNAMAATETNDMTTVGYWTRIAFEIIISAALAAIGFLINVRLIQLKAMNIKLIVILGEISLKQIP